jgi:hypothetical protein
MNWKYFCGACILGGALTLKMGAPLFTVIAGIALAALWKIRKERGRRAHEEAVIQPHDWKK